MTEPHWIPCSEKLPEPEIDVLVYYPRWYNDMFSQSGIVVSQLMSDGLTWDICGEFNPGLHSITHWMPLPEKPKEGDEDADL